MNALRRAVMDEIDEIHYTTNGTSPDHIIVSDAIWRGLERNRAFEKTSSADAPRRRAGLFGFMGMRVWRASFLDDAEDDFILLTEAVFKEIFPTASDMDVSYRRL